MTDVDPAKTRRFARAVDRLPEQERSIFLAVSRDGKTIAEIAERMGITTHEAEHLLADAIVRLHHDIDRTQRLIRNGSIRERWNRLRRRLPARRS